jgi:RND family efflux transporter MFP subunit
MRLLLLITACLVATPLLAETTRLQLVPLTEWKSVYGTVEARETVPARARIGGTVQSLSVTEGDFVTAGQEIAVIHDDKIAFQVAAYDAQIEALQSQLETAKADLDRGQALVDRGVATVQRLDQLRTQVDVIAGQITSTEAQRKITMQQANEGKVLAPGDGRVLTVPATLGSVLLPGEPVATIGEGGFFLRLAVPERHAASLTQGAAIRITAGGTVATGSIAKIYPQIENGRVVADVDVEALDAAFVNARVLVELPIGTREALVVPAAAVVTRGGLDFVQVMENGAEVERTVVTGDPVTENGATMVEVLSGLNPGDEVVTK